MRLSLAETRKLALRLKLPGNRDEIVAHDSDAPLYGWRVVRGRGLVRHGKTQGDLFVDFRVDLPGSWASWTSLDAVAPNHTFEASEATCSLEAPTESELAACVRAGAFLPL